MTLNFTSNIWVLFQLIMNFYENLTYHNPKLPKKKFLNFFLYTKVTTFYQKSKKIIIKLKFIKIGGCVEFGFGQF